MYSANPLSQRERVARASGPGEGYRRNLFNTFSFLYLSLQDKDSQIHTSRQFPLRLPGQAEFR